MSLLLKRILSFSGDCDCDDSMTCAFENSVYKKIVICYCFSVNTVTLKYPAKLPSCWLKQFTPLTFMER